MKRNTVLVALGTFGLSLFLARHQTQWTRGKVLLAACSATGGVLIVRQLYQQRLAGDTLSIIPENWRQSLRMLGLVLDRFLKVY